MKTIARRLATFALAAPLLLSVAIRAQELTQADKDKAMAYLESTKKNLLDATKGLSDVQWSFKSAPDRWSVAQCMEHIAAAEDLLRTMDIEQVMKAPAAPGRNVVEIDEMIISKIPDRSVKAQAPEPLKPTDRFGSPAAATQHFVESRAKTEEFLKTTPDLRQHATDSPLGVKLDAYEWILFIAAHSERHTKQILEVKADPDFPKS